MMEAITTKSLYGLYFQTRALKSVLIVDSKSLYETLTTLRQSKDYRLCKILTQTRDFFETKELSFVR